MKMSTTLFTLAASLVSVTATFASDDAAKILASSAPVKVLRVITDGKGPGDKTATLSLDGCILTQTVLTPMDGSEKPHRNISVIDLRVAGKVSDTRFDEKRGVDLVRVSLKKGKLAEISDAFQPAKEAFAAEIARLEQERGIGFVDFEARKALAEEVVDAMIQRINGREFGAAPAQAYTAASGRIQPPLPHLQLFLAQGTGQAVANALETHRAGECTG